MQAPLSPVQLQTVDLLLGLIAHARTALPGAAVPCFGRLRIESGGRTRDLLLGWRTVTDGPITILDWQTAPLAAVFFSHQIDEPYELEIGGRTLEGTVRSRELFVFEGSELVEIATHDAVWSRRAGTAWSASSQPPQRMLLPRPPGAARAPAPWTLEALDDAQRAAVGRPAGVPMLVLGEAGCGKTTVALHRVATLSRACEGTGQPFRALVLCPVEGLRRLSESMLTRLGALGAEVKVFERWAAVQARRAFPGIPRRLSTDVPVGVARIKRHPALRTAVATVARRRKGKPVSREDLHDLFGDRLLMEDLANDSVGAITPRAVANILEHTRVQYEATSDETFADVEASRREAVDGLRIDAGTPTETAGTIDAEDHAVLFAIALAREGRRAAAPETYDCVVIDESQEFSPIELSLVGRALRPGGTLVVAGDEGQQVDPTAYFPGWASALAELGAPTFETVRLAVSYRCPPAVTTLARAVLAPGEQPPLSSVDPGDDAVTTHRAPTECHLVAALCDDLRDVRARDRDASIAIICRTAEAAKRTAALVSRGEPATLVRDGDFRFGPGVEVTCVHDVKGLEFDLVVVPDAHPGAYPDDDASRRALYVAATRASFQLALATAGSWAAALRNGR